MTIIWFDVVAQRRRVKLACTVCGKVLKRIISVHQTLNPVNCDGYGKTKSEAQIRAELPGMLDTLEKRERKTARR